MKKTVGVGTIFAVVVAIIFLFNQDKDARLPQYGVYGILQNSFYAFYEGEEKNIYIDLYAVTPKGQSDYFLEGCKDFKLVDITGKESPIYIQKEKVSLVNCDYEYHRNVDLSQYTIPVKLVDVDRATYVSLTYQDAKGNMQSCDLGNIEVCTVSGGRGDISAYSNRINWVSYVQPAFQHAELILLNETEGEILVTGLNYGNTTGIEIAEKISVPLKSHEEKELDFQVRLKEEGEGQPIVYYLKPIVEYVVENENVSTAFLNVSKEAYYGETEQIFDYLYQIK